jgi:oxygen-independent coproporphyrinogen-3 oxidase
MMGSMGFGIYVHIPYCLQICSYCDFSKYEIGTVMPPAQYTNLLIQEIQQRASDVPNKEVSSIYFGGGTPSIVEPDLILAVLGALATAGFTWGKTAELSIEIDPATVDQTKLDAYLRMGFNRFSVGVQSFNSGILKIAGRKHTAQDAVDLLTHLKDRNLNFSFDLLFAMPTQTLSELKIDLAMALDFNPSHLSAYCLTVPEDHRLSVGRAPEGEQIEMFSTIQETLAKKGLQKYELSNFAKPGHESKHNLLHWRDRPYWGIGLSSHSYFPNGSKSEPLAWGGRFWNNRSMSGYVKEVGALNSISTAGQGFRFFRDLDVSQIEQLELRQSLTDYCHTHLRMGAGLEKNALRLKFGAGASDLANSRLMLLQEEMLVEKTSGGWRLSRSGQNLANLVFEKLTFLPGDLP